MGLNLAEWTWIISIGWLCKDGLVVKESFQKPVRIKKGKTCCIWELSIHAESGVTGRLISTRERINRTAFGQWLTGRD